MEKTIEKTLSQKGEKGDCGGEAARSRERSAGGACGMARFQSCFDEVVTGERS